MMDRSKKGQVGLVTGLVFGVATLIIGVIIALVITSTLSDANLLEGGRTTTAVTNESEAWLNATDYTLDEVAANRLSYTLTSIWSNQGGLYNVTIPTANATVSAAGVVVTAGADDYSNVSMSYTYITQSSEEYSAGFLTGNFTEGIDNVSTKIPTVLLIAAIVLILGILALLVGVWQSMRIGGGNI